LPLLPTKILVALLLMALEMLLASVPDGAAPVILLISVERA